MAQSSADIPSIDSNNAEVDNGGVDAETSHSPKLNFFVKQPDGDLEKMKFNLPSERGPYATVPPRRHSRSSSPRRRSVSPERGDVSAE
jgi:hypothetical protein